VVKIFDIKAFDKQPISRVCQASISRIVCVLEHSPFDVSCLAPTTANADNYMKIKVVMLKRLLGGIDYGFGYKLTNCPLWCLGDVLLFDPSGLHCRGQGLALHTTLVSLVQHGYLYHSHEHYSS
jgi:hypothetical protein